MTHRVFDELAQLRRRLAAVEADLDDIRKAGVIDFAELADLRTTRAVLLEQIAAKEASIHDEV